MGDISSTVDQAGTRVVMSLDGDGKRMRRYIFRLTEMLGETVADIQPPRGILELPEGYTGSTEEVEILQQKTNELTKRVAGCDFRVYTPLFGWESVELKSITQYMNRDHGEWQPLLNAPCGTVYFEMLNESGYGWGWLHHYYKPDSMTTVNVLGENNRAHKKELDKVDLEGSHLSTPAEERDTTRKEPVYLLYLLFRKNEKELVASIAFNWVQLKYRLNELTGGELVKLWDEKPNPKRLKEKPWAEGWIVKGRTGGYCWHVPMDKLADIARVTMITGTLREETLDEKEWPRYEWLKEHSQGRTIEVTKEDLRGEKNESNDV